ncbi:MAG TPA: MDR family MFS transporter [Sphingobacteriaceae bacterium]|nr:MDR family MFS transporter [Sphingobacteriaceae bacterium]
MDEAQRRRVVASVLLATFLAAIDITIIETAMPRIVGALGGFSMLTWLVTAYMLTSTATIPIYGKLADLIGRKRTFIIGAIIFVVGSALCGMAGSMFQLIMFRALQGLGAGAILPVVQTILGDIFSPAERARFQGLFSSVFGLSAMMGPLLGGIIVDYFTWRWLFYINLPLGIVSIYTIQRNLHEKIERRQAQVDYLGAILLTVAISALLLALLTGGVHYPWGSPVIIGMLVASVVLFIWFIGHEQRHPDPMMPLHIFRVPTIGVANLVTFVVGGVMFGTSVYLPIWAQGVQGYSATRSGLSLLWLSIGWPLASAFGGRFIIKVGTRPAAMLGLALNAVASAGLVYLSHNFAEIPQIGFAVVTFVIGAGMGFNTLAFILSVQSATTWEYRGVATASLQFVRTLGGMVWVAVMGAALNLTLLSRLRSIPELGVSTVAEAGQLANNLLDPRMRAAIGENLVGLAQGALADGLRVVHWVVLLAAVLSLALTFLLPNQDFRGEGAPQEAEAGEGGPPPGEAQPEKA